jgi:glycosyltransferase involved in cell wall biosynthesis
MIAVTIPCYRERDHILGVLERIGDECDLIIVVDDGCPEGTGKFVEEQCADPRVKVVYHGTNRGVGAATLTGYEAALEGGAGVIVKLDGDGQMDPALIPRLVKPILDGAADYTKGNRFFELEGLRSMPRARLVGNSLLSFANKLSSGYWNLFDPTNGFTAIHAAIARILPLDQVDRGYYFESDLLFRLGTLRAVVMDVPMRAAYHGEESSLGIPRAIFEFSAKHAVNTVKRIFYCYFLRDFNIASLELILGLAFFGFGSWIGATRWVDAVARGVYASSGTVMLAALPVIIGIQMLLAFMNRDLQNIPTEVLHKKLASEI